MSKIKERFKMWAARMLEDDIQKLEIKYNNALVDLEREKDLRRRIADKANKSYMRGKSLEEEINALQANLNDSLWMVERANMARNSYPHCVPVQTPVDIFEKRGCGRAGSCMLQKAFEE